jgi:hypothetical protein
MHSGWRCADCGEVPPFHVAQHIGPEILATALAQGSGALERPPTWCPWPLPPGWTVTGVGWAGDERTGVRATALSVSGPGPLDDGPADVVIVAEQPGVGLGMRMAGISGVDPGPQLADAMADAGAHAGPHAKVRVGGHPTPLWSVKSPADRSAYVSEARGMWLYAVAWPASAGFILADHVELHDLSEWVPPELVFGAPSPYLRGRV